MRYAIPSICLGVTLLSVYNLITADDPFLHIPFVWTNGLVTGLLVWINENKIYNTIK